MAGLCHVRESIVRSIKAVARGSVYPKVDMLVCCTIVAFTLIKVTFRAAQVTVPAIVKRVIEICNRTSISMNEAACYRIERTLMGCADTRISVFFCLVHPISVFELIKNEANESSTLMGGTAARTTNQSHG